MNNFAWAPTPAAARRGRQFAELTGLRQRDGWQKLVRGVSRWPHPPVHGIPGADHALGWWIGRGINKWVITTEPYRQSTGNLLALERFCAEYGWSLLYSEWPGMWNPPHTRLVILSPPIHGICPRWVEDRITAGGRP